MANHSGLRKRESEKRSHGVKGNQAIGYAAKHDEQQSCDNRENQDALRIDEPASASG